MPWYSHATLCAVCVFITTATGIDLEGALLQRAFIPHSKNIQEALKQNVSRLISKAKHPLIRDVFFGNGSFLPPKYVNYKR